MIHTRALPFLAMLLALPLSAQDAPALAPVGPLGYWKGDDGPNPKSAVDSSGNGFHGTYSAGATISPTVAKIKDANPSSLQLDGATGVITIPDAPVLHLNRDFSISFWKRKTTRTKDYARLIGKGNGAARNFGLWEAPGEDDRLLFQMYAQGGQPVIDLWSSTPVKPETWVHVIVTISVNSCAMYFNGTLVGNGMRAGEPGTSGDPLTFGHAGFHTFWAGQLDDIRLYNRALSMSEIVYLSAGNGAPAPPAALVAKSAVSTQVTLQWTPSPTPAPAGTATYYRVLRAAAPGQEFTAVGSMLTGAGFSDLKVEAGKTYVYRVTAVNTGGESVPSNELSVAVPK
jgi:hypothetical protein